MPLLHTYLHFLDGELVVGLVHGVVDGGDTVRRRVALRLRQVGSQYGVVNRVQVHSHGVKAFVIVPNL